MDCALPSSAGRPDVRLYLSSFRLGNAPEHLIRLLQGRTRTAIILNADDYKSPKDRRESLAREVDALEGLGLEPRELDLREFFEAPGQLGAVLGDYDLVWIRGGNGFLLRKAFAQSRADEVIPQLLADDAVVYAGYSAGVVVLTPSLEGVDFIDDPNVVPPGYDVPLVRECLGVLPYHVMPHYRSDHPESEGVELAVQHLIDHHVPFVALRDGEAIVREGDREFVVG